MMVTLLHILLTFLDSLEFKRTQTDLKDILSLLSKVIHKIDRNFKMIPQKRGGRLKVMSIMQTQTKRTIITTLSPQSSSPLKKKKKKRLGNTFPFPGRNSPSATL